jgi:hypothetical protein
MELSSKKKCTDLTMAEKQEVIKIHRGNSSWSQQLVADEFNKLHPGKNIKKNTISQLVKFANRIIEVNLDIVKGKRMKEFMYLELEVALVAWFK